MKRRPNLVLLGPRLDALKAEWSGQRLDSDPLLFPHRFARPDDREVVALLASALAFGRVASIKTSLEKVVAALGPSPARFLEAWDGTPLPLLDGFVHRWVRQPDLEALLSAIARVRRAHGSLREAFAKGDPGGDDFVFALDSFHALLRAEIAEPHSHGVRFLLPSPSAGTACKRAHLFLRWMVRSEDVDLGLFTGGLFTPARLLLPLDTHVHRIATYLGLTLRPTADLTASREATAWLKLISPEDPVGYDWALSRLGILAECLRGDGRRHCERCAVRTVCREAA